MLNYICCCFTNKKILKSDNINDNIIKLEKIDANTISYFNFKGQKFVAKPCNIYDGDTFSIIFYYKNDIIKYRCRCLGYDSPEMKPLLSNPNRDHEKELALKAKERFTELLTKNNLVNIECFDFDKYGRILVNVSNGIDELLINTIMINEKHGKVYDGGKKNTEW